MFMVQFCLRKCRLFDAFFGVCFFCRRRAVFEPAAATDGTAESKPSVDSRRGPAESADPAQNEVDGGTAAPPAGGRKTTQPASPPATSPTPTAAAPLLPGAPTLSAGKAFECQLGRVDI